MTSLFKTVTRSGSASDSENDKKVVSFQSSSSAVQKIFIKELELEMSIGVFDTEKGVKQRVIVSVELTVEASSNWRADDIAAVVSYADIVEKIQILAAHKHVELVETFAEMIIEMCFMEETVSAVSVSVEKPDIIAAVKAVGISISRNR